MRYSRLILAASVSLLPAADVNVLEEIIAKINGDIITKSELEKGKESIRQAIAAEAKQQRGIAKDEIEKMFQEKQAEVLRDRIDQLLLIQKGKELNINVDPDVTRQIGEIQKQAGIADPEKFQAYVKKQTGMTYEDYKSEMKNGLLTQRVIRQEVGRDINIPKPELRKYYDEHAQEFVRKEAIFLREILISIAGKDAAGVAASEKKAKDLVARARKGEKFPELARDNSDSDSAKNFGDIGGHEKGDLRKEIVDAVWEQPRNYVSEPLKLETGFLILKVEEKHKAGQASYEEVESEIMERFYSTRFTPKIREYLTKLRQDAFVEIKEGYRDVSAAPGKGTQWSDPAQLKPETVSKNEVAARFRKKKLLWSVPVPGTKTQNRSTSKS